MSSKTKNENEKILIDPMATESSEEEFEKKKQKWMDIFQFHPDFANLILDLIDEYGDEVYDKLVVMHKDGKVHLGWAD